ncbi:MAG: DsrE family protein [Candidatus Rokubacteria bacterium]|nr:DsrE family protein [Candidatus Rokubacteria bacterium]MBI2553671.1 DsrE family protein [Candidatus Rokubacteria bacterium]
MAQYLLVESKSPLEGGEHAFELAKQLRELRHNVTIYLVQDAVFAARKRFEAGEKLLAEAKTHNLTLLADEISLRQRGITKERLSEGVRVSNADELIDLLMEKSDKAIWH